MMKEDDEELARVVAEPVEEENELQSFHGAEVRKTWMIIQIGFWILIWISTLNNKTGYTSSEYILYVVLGFIASVLLLPASQYFNFTPVAVYLIIATYSFFISRVIYNLFFNEENLDIMHIRYGKEWGREEYQERFLLDILYALFWPIYLIPAIIDFAVYNICIFFTKTY